MGVRPTAKSIKILSYENFPLYGNLFNIIIIIIAVSISVIKFSDNDNIIGMDHNRHTWILQLLVNEINGNCSRV